MLNVICRLTGPGVFREFQEEVEFPENRVLVCPTHLSICHADQRYYQGLRPEEILKSRLPMALIHEAAGKILWDPKGIWEPGQRAVFIPNQPDSGKEEETVQQKEKCLKRVEENYLCDSRFRGSSMDGFLQEIVAMPRDRILIFPENIPMEVGAFTEMVSVSFHGIKRLKIGEMTKEIEGNVQVAVWGDGNLGYLTGLLLKVLFPRIRLHVFGVNREKLEYFTFADCLHWTDRISGEEFGEEKAENQRFHIAFECVGGEASGIAIGEMIKRMEPEGRIALLGVSEYAVPIATRTILEKGLILVGNSRSSRTDFEEVIKLYREKKEFVEALYPLIGEVLPIRSLKELSKAFEKDISRRWGKTILLKYPG